MQQSSKKSKSADVLCAQFNDHFICDAKSKIVLAEDKRDFTATDINATGLRQEVSWKLSSRGKFSLPRDQLRRQRNDHADVNWRKRLGEATRGYHSRRKERF